MAGPELILLAERPRAGESKPGLAPSYTPQQAADVAAALIEATVELAVASWPGTVSLYGWPDLSHEIFGSLAREKGIRLGTQHGTDCGARLYGALGEAVTRSGAAAVMRADVPHCPWQVIDQANEWLAEGYSVLGPAENGDCYFLGLQNVDPALFEDIPWGTPRLVEALCRRADETGFELELLPALHLIDTAHDLWLLSQTCEALRPLVK
jgi:glycosyltransferase A (GT-A) superfamily protein (DUF2064 family)